MATSAAEEKTKPLRMEAAARGGIVIVAVGPECIKYHVHRAVLTNHSEYFKKALEGPWKEAEEGVVRLEDVEPETLGIFVDWIYSQKTVALEYESAYDEKAYQIAMIKAYIFGDRFPAPAFTKAVRYKIVEEIIHEQQLYYETVTYAVENLAAEDSLQKMMVDVMCDYYEECWDEDQEEAGYAEMIRTYRTWKSVEELKECDYHNHTSEAEKAACEKRL